jgi:hypothetical protein
MCISYVVNEAVTSEISNVRDVVFVDLSKFGDGLSEAMLRSTLENIFIDWFTSNQSERTLPDVTIKVNTTKVLENNYWHYTSLETVRDILKSFLPPSLKLLEGTPSLQEKGLLQRGSICTLTISGGNLSQMFSSNEANKLVCDKNKVCEYHHDAPFVCSSCGAFRFVQKHTFPEDVYITRGKITSGNLALGRKARQAQVYENIYASLRM